MTPLDYLLILEGLILLSAGVFTAIAEAGARDNPQDKLRRVMRKFWREFKRPTVVEVIGSMPLDDEDEVDATFSKAGKKRKGDDDVSTITSTLSIKVVPGSSQNQIAGKLGDAVKIQVTAPPEAGEANKAVIDLLAEALGITSYRIKLIRGHYDSRKVMQITGLTSEQVESKLAKYF
jgi:uncharacterized protein (TIGR00251 family)